MRILHVVTVFERGGAQTVVLELARAQLEAGHEVGIMAGAEGGAWEELPPGALGFPEPSFQKAVSLRADLACMAAIGRVLRSYRPDILQLHSSKAGALGRVAALGMRKRVIYTVHGFDTIRLGHPAYLPLERALAGLCGAVVAVSEYDRANLKASGISGALCVRNGMRDFSGDPPHPRKDLIAAFEADRRAGRKVVLSLARLAPPKRFDLFLELARSMEEEAFSFYWLGNREGITAELPRNLRVLGDIPEARLLLRHADLFCLLSDYEGLPMSAIEALCAGLPVLASAVGGLAEAVDASCGALAANESAALAGALREIASRPGLGAGARRRYLERFTLDGMAQGYDNLYRALIEGRGAAASTGILAGTSNENQ